MFFHKIHTSFSLNDVRWMQGTEVNSNHENHELYENNKLYRVTIICVVLFLASIYSDERPHLGRRWSITIVVAIWSGKDALQCSNMTVRW